MSNYGTESAVTDNFFTRSANGDYLLVGTIPYAINFNNWILKQRGDSVGYDMVNYIALFDSSFTLKWVKYVNGAFTVAETDDDNNIYLAGKCPPVFKTSTGEVLASTNAYGFQLCVLKLDNSGNLKWCKMSQDRRGYSESFNYLEFDKTGNIYLYGFYDDYLKFDSNFILTRTSPYMGYQTFVAKMDSNGSFIWMRNSGLDAGLPSGLIIDSCHIYAFTNSGALERDIRYRKYDPGGKLNNWTIFSGATGANSFGNTVDIRKNRIIGIRYKPYDWSIAYSDLEGNYIWSKKIKNLSISHIQFTEKNIFFAGSYASDDSSASYNNIELVKAGHPPTMFFGFIDTSGNLLSVKNLPNIAWPSDFYLSKDGRVYVAALLTPYTNQNNSTFDIDTIRFQGLSFMDTVPYQNGGGFYKVLAQFNTGEQLYTDKSTCNFNPVNDSCLDIEGNNKCFPLPGPFNLTVSTNCSDIITRIILKWTPSANTDYYEIYKSNVLFKTFKDTAEIVDEEIEYDKTYRYSVTAFGKGGAVQNTNGKITIVAANCVPPPPPPPPPPPTTVQDFSIRVFPAISAGAFSLEITKIKSKTVDVVILNTTGQVVYAWQKNTDLSSLTKQFDLSKQNSGLYFIQVQVNDKRYVLKYIKQ